MELDEYQNNMASNSGKRVFSSISANPLMFVVQCMPSLVEDQEKLISYVKLMLPLDTSIESRGCCLQALLAYANLSPEDDLECQQPSQGPWNTPQFKRFRQVIFEIVWSMLQDNPRKQKKTNKPSSQTIDCNQGRIQRTLDFIDILRYLITEGADPSFIPTQRKGKSSLYLFLHTMKEVLAKHSNLFDQLVEILEMLMTDKSVDADLIDASRRTVLHALVDSDWSDLSDLLQTDFAIQFKNIVSRVVAKNHALLDAKDARNQTPIHTFLHAVLKHNILDGRALRFLTEVLSLLKSETNFSLQDNRGYTVLHEIMSMAHNLHKDNLDQFMQLINQLKTKSNIETSTCDGHTVLYLLARKLNKLLVGDCNELLKVFGSILSKNSINKMDNDSLTPYSWILYWKHLFKDGKIKRTQRETEMLSKVEMIFKANDAQSNLDEYGWKCISVKHLLDNLNTKDDLAENGQEVMDALVSTDELMTLKGSTVLCDMIAKVHLMIESDHYFPIIKVLLSLDINTNTRNECLRALLMHTRKSPILWIDQEFKNILQCFIVKGADPTWVPEKQNNSALSIFFHTIREIIFEQTHIYHQCKDILEILMVKDFQATDFHGQSPLHIFMDGNWKDLDAKLRTGYQENFKDVVKAVASKYCEFIDLQDHHKRSPLQLLIYNILKDNPVLTKEIIDFLSEMIAILRSQRNVDMQDDLGSTILHNLLNAIPQTTLKDLENLLDLTTSLQTSQNTECQMENGETVLHILMRNICNPLKVNVMMTLINRLQLFATEKNIDLKDSNLATPFSWMLILKKSPEADLCGASTKVDEIGQILQPDLVSAENGLKCIRGKDMAELLKTTEWTRNELDEVCQKLEEIKALNYPQCLTSLVLIRETISFTILFLRVWNLQIQQSAKKIILCLIDGDNLHKLFPTYMMMMYQNLTWQSQFVFSSWLWLLEVCIKAGAKVTTEDIEKVSGTFKRCRSTEEQIAVLNTLHTLLKSYRSEGNTDVVKCEFDVLGEQYFVDECILELACTVVHLSYNTLENCITSKNLINVLLFVRNKKSKGIDEQLLKEYFNQLSQNCESNWLRRGFTHLAAMFCDDENILRCVPEDLIDVDKKDLHGCTPLHVAFLHHNYKAVMLLELHGATDMLDYYNCNPESLASRPGISCINQELVTEHNRQEQQSEDHQDASYQRSCMKIYSANSGVFEKLKPMLVIPENKRTLISDQFKSLFENLVKHTEYYQYFVRSVVTGSLREGLKVGRLDEVDIHIQFRIPVHEDSSTKSAHQNVRFDAKTFGKTVHDSLVNALDKISWDGIPLRLINVNHPWQFLCEPPLEHIIVSVDISPVLLYDVNAREKISHQQSMILEKSQTHKKMEFLKWAKRYNEGNSFLESYAKFEWDIIDCVPTDCRLGILVVKALLQVYYWSNGMMRDSDFPINSYMVKTALFWLLSNETLYDSEGAEVKLQKSVMHDAALSKLKYEPNPKWINDEDLHKNAEEGRKWAFDILTVILHVASDHERKLPNYFGAGSVLQTCGIGQADHIVQICNNLLQKLKREVFC